MKQFFCLYIHKNKAMASAKREAIEAFLEAAKNAFPNEFIGLLAGNKEKNIVEELVVVPAIFGENFSSIYTHLVPFDSTLMGTAHSHPSRSNNPSIQDLAAFSKTGTIHLIACYPYMTGNVKAFDGQGRKIELKII